MSNLDETYEYDDYYEGDHNYDNDNDDNNNNNDNAPSAVPVTVAKSTNYKDKITNLHKYLKELHGEEKLDELAKPLSHLYTLARNKQAIYDSKQISNKSNNKTGSKFTNKTVGLCEQMSWFVNSVYTMLCVMAKNASSKADNHAEQRYCDYANQFNNIINHCLTNRAFVEDHDSVFHCFKIVSNQWPTYLTTFIASKKVFTEDQLKLKGMFIHYHHVFTQGRFKTSIS